MTKEQLEQATLQVLIANFQDPNTTPSFDRYSKNDIYDALQVVLAVETVVDECTDE